MSRTGWRRQLTLLAAVLMLALALRLWHLDWGLPYLEHPDEANKVEIAVRMLQTGDLNPHYFKKPPFFLALQALLYLPYYLAGRLGGTFHNMTDLRGPQMIALAVGRAPQPVLFVLGRLLSTLAAIASVALVYRLALLVYRRQRAALLAAALLALSPTSVSNSRYVTVDALETAALLAAILLAVRLYRRGRWRDYLAAGALVGLAASFKYPAVLAALLLPLAHWLRRPNAPSIWRLAAGLACVPLVFAALNPAALLDAAHFLPEALGQAAHYARGHAGMEGAPLAWYLSYALRWEGLVPLLAVVEIGRQALRRDREKLLVVAFPAAYFALITALTVRNDRTFLPLVPICALFAGALLDRLARGARRVGHAGRVAPAALVLLVFLTCAIPAGRTLATGLRLGRPDGRDAARAWIAAHLPAGSRVVVEAYGPWIDPDVYHVSSPGWAISHDPDWYLSQGVDFLVFAQGAYGRFFDDPTRYPDAVARYQQLFARWQPLALFDDNDYQVRIVQLAR